MRADLTDCRYQAAPARVRLPRALFGALVLIAAVAVYSRSQDVRPSVEMKLAER